jgi:hypothetical protein
VSDGEAPVPEPGSRDASPQGTTGSLGRRIARGRLRRRLVWSTVVGAVFALVLAIIGSTQPNYRRVTTRSGLQYDVISATRDNGIASLFGPVGRRLQTAIVVEYYAPNRAERTPDNWVREARELLELAAPAAQQTGDSLIVFRRRTPIGPRWSGVFRGDMIALRRQPNEQWVVLTR